MFWKRRKTEHEPQEAVVQVHVTDTGRVWVDPKQVVRTDEFKRQQAAVKRLREKREQTNSEELAF